MANVLVRFYNKQSQALHSAVQVEVDKLVDAVPAARKLVYDAHNADPLESCHASVCDAATGAGFPTLDNQLSKADIERKVAELQKQLAGLNDDGSSPVQNEQAARTVPDWYPDVTAPPVAAPASFGPTPPNAPPQNIAVDPSQAPRGTTAPVFTSADIAAQQAATEAETKRLGGANS